MVVLYEDLAPRVDVSLLVHGGDEGVLNVYARTASMLIYTYPDGWARAVNEAGNHCIIAGDIEHVICDGKWLKKDGEMQTIDMKKALTSA